MASITSSLRQKLKSDAHHLKPLVRIGHKGLTDTLIIAVDDALESHELIKLKFMEYKDDKKQLSYKIAADTSSEVIGFIGNTVILYRENKDKAESGKD